MRFVVGLCLTAAAGALHAAPLAELTGGASPRSPLGARTVPTGPAAAYFNPALLFEGPRVVVQMGSMRRDLKISYRDRPVGHDVPESIYAVRRIVGDGTERLAHRPLPTVDLRAERGSADASGSTTWLSVGATSLWLDDRLAVSGWALLPLGAFQAQRPFYVDETAQYFDNSLHFERYEDRLESATFTGALAVDVGAGFTVGAGATFLNNARSQASIFVPDATDQARTETNPSVSVEGVLAPHFGAQWRAESGRLRASATLHLESKTEVTAISDIQIWNYGYPDGAQAISQTVKLTYGYEPLRAAMGVEHTWAVGAGLISGHLQVLMARWSTYEDRQSDTPEGWQDTWTPTASVRVAASAHSVVFSGAFEPSPVPEQTGRTSYVDNDRLTTALGWQWALKRGLAVGAVAFAHRLMPRSVTKSAAAVNPILDELPDSEHVITGDIIPESRGLQTNSPGFPGFGSEGWLWGGALTVTLTSEI